MSLALPGRRGYTGDESSERVKALGGGRKLWLTGAFQALEPRP